MVCVCMCVFFFVFLFFLNACCSVTLLGPLRSLPVHPSIQFTSYQVRSRRCAGTGSAAWPSSYASSRVRKETKKPITTCQPHDSPHYPPPHHHSTTGDDKSGESRSYRISTLAGVIVPVVRGDGLVTVDMGTPILEGEALRC